MATSYTIDIDVKEVEKKLSETSLHVEKVVKKMLRVANKEVITQAKNNARSLFRTFNNNDSDNANPPILKSFSQYVLYRNDSFAAWVHDRTLHAAVMEKGAEIKPINGNYLTLKVNGQWRKVQGVSIPARPFASTAFNGVYKTGKAEELMKAELDKELDKFWNG
jgi:hypothetical protein